ncbi:MAG: bifunctional diaminohydroxyphosphoribosylaminopyrimidine deaminase/5-amino-6-(5-phosphoribosylamino)uracil reductase RibD [Actinobacteria bacterium]|nr:MAG: bifunctional diaminohydroxyphosphoribosylaminopyrimidine deaminase/5-amino-6-(5-phosphoribosylamino)uracil reductase RibD [Actinomycetota bacterium]
MSLERALELAERGRDRVEHTHPVVGAVVVSDGEVVGEGWYAGSGSPHAEVAALEAAGDRARGATLYVTLEPCAHRGSTPPCADAVVAAGVTRVVAGAGDPNPKVDGRGFERLREGGVDVEVADSWEARRQNEAWRIWISRGRPFVTYKVAITLDGRVTIPGSRWVSGEESRRRVHELRAEADAVAVGMGTVRADDPALTAREVEVERQPRRLALGSGPLPEGSELELRSGPLEDELRALARDGVRSLLLEGGPTLASSFLAADLVDKLLVFVAPRLSGAGAGPVAALPEPLELRHMTYEQIGEDVLLTAYVHEP